MRWFFGGLLGFALLGSTGPASAAIEQDILVELNLARTQPAQYAGKLRAFRALFQGDRYRKPGADMIMVTQEGVAAVDEAIAFLERQAPLPPLAAQPQIAAAASDHAADIGPKGLTQHDGSDGSKPWDRVKRRGFTNWRSLGEGIAFGPDTGESVVIGLIVDDGVPDRGHRKSIFTASYRLAGVACGPHKTYRIVCVIDYAEPK
ncbi:MAG: CAP domain-containing protein [Elsteraceae bacterium]